MKSDFSRLPDQLPDAQALTAELRQALESTAAEVQTIGTPESDQVALELTTLRNTIASPLHSYAELPELDKAIHVTIGKLPDLCRFAPPTEISQSLKQLRRLILCDRRRIDPDPKRQQLSLSICIRQLWLIEHRIDLFRSRSELREAQHLLDVIPAGHPQMSKLQEHHTLLKTYCETQEAYCASVHREMQELQIELRS